MTYKKKNGKIEIDFVSVFLLIGLIISYALLGIMMTFIIVTSHAPLALKIIGGSEWLVIYTLYAVSLFYWHSEVRSIFHISV